MQIAEAGQNASRPWAALREWHVEHGHRRLVERSHRDIRHDADDGEPDERLRRARLGRRLVRGHALADRILALEYRARERLRDHRDRFLAIDIPAIDRTPAKNSHAHRL